MTAPTEVKVPDIGGFDDVPIIEVHVSVGDKVNAEDPLITLESDKATMDVPAPTSGTVGEVLIKVGDSVREGSPILLLAPGDAAMSTPPSLVEQQNPHRMLPRRNLRRRRQPARPAHRPTRPLRGAGPPPRRPGSGSRAACTRVRACGGRRASWEWTWRWCRRLVPRGGSPRMTCWRS